MPPTDSIAIYNTQRRKTTALFPLPRTNLTGYRLIVADSDDGRDASLLAFQDHLDRLLQAPVPPEAIMEALERISAALSQPRQSDLILILRDSDLLQPVNLVRVARPGLAAAPSVKSASRSRPPPVKLVVLVVLWLILVVGPLADGKLPPEIVTMLGTEVGTVALGLAITQAVNQKRK